MSTTTKTTRKAATPKLGHTRPAGDTVEKETQDGRKYDVVAGRYVVWSADVWDDEEPFEVVIPLRFKVGALRPMKDLDINEPAVMIDMLAAIVPGINQTLDAMDVNDMVDMFGAWFREYNGEQGADPGEASRSSS